MTFWGDDHWKLKWKKGSSNKDMFLTWLRVLFSFLPAELWVTAAVLLHWGSSECSSCFFQNTFSSGFSSHQYVLFLGEGLLQLNPGFVAGVPGGMAFGRLPTSLCPLPCPVFLCSRSFCSLPMSLWMTHHKLIAWKFIRIQNGSWLSFFAKWLPGMTFSWQKP